MADLTTLSAHFAFGENWRAYSRLIDEERIEQATKDLSRMMGGRLDGLSFLDIGCGSGLHAIAALRLGAREVVGVDLDPVSVATAVESLERFVPGAPWRIQELSVFNLEAAGLPCFDVVYSWGVLHHTGDMWRAIASASRRVAPGGRLALALYRRTVLCGLWRREKKWYASATPDAQQRAQRLYLGLLRLGCLATGRSFEEFVQRYNTKRGMDYLHDLHDWLGGYPYQSVGARFLKRRLSRMGFGIEVERSRGLQLGLLGSGCDEFTFRRTR